MKKVTTVVIQMKDRKSGDPVLEDLVVRCRSKGKAKKLKKLLVESGGNSDKIQIYKGNY